MDETSHLSVAQLRRLLEARCTNRPKLVRQKNTFGKVAAIVQDLKLKVGAE